MAVSFRQERNLISVDRFDAGERFVQECHHDVKPRFRSWVAFTAVLSRADGWFGLVVGALNQAGSSPGGGFRILPPKYLR